MDFKRLLQASPSFGFILTTIIILMLWLPVSRDTGNAYENKVGIRFVYLQGGTFLMGSPPSETGHRHDEKLHRVTIRNGFYISETEITQKQWTTLMDNNPSAFRECGDNCPVDNVSWHDCQEFIKRLNQYEATRQYRLPTEAEWEYACKAGTQTAFCNGVLTKSGCDIDSNLDQVGWYCGNSGRRNPVSDLKPHPAGSKKPNAWGLYDMHGNVHEWCLDACRSSNWWSTKIGVYTDTYKDGIIDPLSTKGNRRVFRGGSWNASAKHCRSAARSCFKPTVKRNNIGFRIVKVKTTTGNAW
jgi:formylglycine-generating enzyme required for sulfatase activity